MMKKIVFGVLIGFLFMLGGCLDDEDSYSLGDIYLGFGTLEDAESHKILMDNGEFLIPVAYEYPWEANESRDGFQNGDRLIVNFTILDEETNADGDTTAFYVRVNSVKEILLKGILDLSEEIEDSIGNDPIIIKEAWVTNNLLNVKIRYWGRYETHYINLVKQPGNLTADSQPIALELRHNDNNDEEEIPYTSFVSFKLDTLQIAGLDSVNFRVTYTDYDGESHELDKVYKYGENN